MKIPASDATVQSDISVMLKPVAETFLGADVGDDFIKLWNSIFTILSNKYVALGCTYIGDWDDTSEGSSNLALIYVANFQEFFPNIKMLLGADFINGIISELNRTFGGTDTLKVNGMTEMSPITATLGEINTPDGKTIRNETDTYGKTETVSDPDMQMKMREMYSQYKTIVSMVDYCYRSLLDEYTKLY